MSQNGLNHLIGRMIQVNRKGPDSFKGQLLDLKSDYLVLDTDKARVYLPTFHIRSIGAMSNDHSDSEESNWEEAQDYQEYFEDLMASLKHQWVQIDGGPNKVEGVIVDFSRENVILSVKDQVVSIVLSHIKNVVIKKQEKQNNQENNSSDQEQNSEQNSNKQEKEENVAKETDNYVKVRNRDSERNVRNRMSDENVESRVSANYFRNSGYEKSSNRINNDFDAVRVYYPEQNGQAKKQNKQKSTGSSKKNTKNKRG